MATGSVTIANAGLGYTHYLPKMIVETMNAFSLPRLLTSVSDRPWKGDHIEFKLHVSRSGAVRYAEDGSSFPEANHQGYIPAKVTRKFMLYKVSLSDGSMITYGSGASVAKDVVSSELSGIATDGQLVEARAFLQGDGTGLVAQLTDASLASGTTSIPVTDGRFLNQFHDGMKFEIRDAASPSTIHSEAVTVSKVAMALNASGYALANFSSTVAGVAANDGLYIKGSYGREVTGLSKLIDDSATTFQAVDCSTHTNYVSYVDDNGGTLRDLDPTILRRALAVQRQRASDAGAAKDLVALGTVYQMEKFEEMYENELRVAPSDKVMGIATSAFQSSLGKFSLIPHQLAKFNTLFIADTSQLKRAVQKEFAWRGGNQGNPLVASQATSNHEATAISVYDFYIENRQNCVRIDDLSENIHIAF